MKGTTLTNPGGNLSPASKSTPKKKSRESSSTQSTPASNPKQKRGRISSEHAEQVGTKRAEEAGPSTAASCAKAVRTSSQRLVITRKGSKGDTLMVDSDLRGNPRGHQPDDPEIKNGFVCAYRENFYPQG